MWKRPPTAVRQQQQLYQTNSNQIKTNGRKNFVKPEKKLNRRQKKTWHMFGKCESWTYEGEKEDRHKRKKTKLNNKWNFQKKNHFILFLFFTLVCMLTVFFASSCLCSPGWVLLFQLLLMHVWMDAGWYNCLLRTTTFSVVLLLLLLIIYCCNNCADVMSNLSLYLCACLSLALSFCNNQISGISFYCWCM